MAAVLGTVGGLAALGSAATGLGSIGAAKLQSGAAGRVAQLTTDAAIRGAEIDRQTAADQLAYVKNQARMDRESKRWVDEQNFGLSQARELSDFYRYGDTATNRRAELVSAGLSGDKRYGATQQQLNTMRALMGMGDKPLTSYVEPGALRLTAPVLPKYVEDPTQYTVDDVDLVPTTDTRRRV
jgi:hypothetical protein